MNLSIWLSHMQARYSASSRSQRDVMKISDLPPFVTGMLYTLYTTSMARPTCSYHDTIIVIGACSMKFTEGLWGLHSYGARGGAVAMDDSFYLYVIIISVRTVQQ